MAEKSKIESAVFIIESLTRSDEKDERFEGRILNHILGLANKEVQYVYIRTVKELETVLKEFGNSRMRYLHFSCHGNANTIALGLENLSFAKFSNIVRPYLYKRRLFFSACEVVNKYLAAKVIPGSGCYSVIGPEKPISFGDAAIMWSSFYHLMFRENQKVMKKEQIEANLKGFYKTFNVPFLYYGSSKSAPEGFKKHVLS